MNRIKYFICFVAIAFGFLTINSISAAAASLSSPTFFSSRSLPKISSEVDQVRDTDGNPLKRNTNYKLQIFSTDPSNKQTYYMYDDYDGSAYDWFWLQTSSSGATAVQINSSSLIETDGKKIHIINGAYGKGEIVRFEADSAYHHGGLYWGNPGHSDRYGFRKVEGDGYKYLLMNNYGGIYANFSEMSITTLKSDEDFVVSFVKV